MSNGVCDQNRVVLLGAGRVGKTSLIQRLLLDSFSDKYRPTVEDIYRQVFDINNRRICIDIMDTSGTYNFPAMRRLCIAKATGWVVVLAQNDNYSFEHARELITQIKEERADWQDTPLVIVLNKTDLKDEIEVTEEALEIWLMKEGIPLTQLVTATAKDGTGVLSVFEKLWEQNEKKRRFVFEPEPIEVTKRRFSAFAILSWSRPHSSSNGSPTSNGHPTVTDGMEFKKRGKFARSKTSTGSRRLSTKSNGASVYNVDCTIS